MTSLIETLTAHFSYLNFHQDYSLASLTTVKIGGPADVFCEVKNRQEFTELAQFCKKNNLPITVIGWGANTLISDAGIRGLVVKFNSQHISILDDPQAELPSSDAEARWSQGDIQKDDYPEFSHLDYDEKQFPKVSVDIDAGVPLPFAINSLLQQGITGLQWFSRIPATIGGSIVNNIHGGTHFMSEYIEEVTVVTPEGELKTLRADELQFDYDYSRFHHSNEILVHAKLVLFKGDVEKAKQVVAQWAVQKKNQPQNSLGCVFQNISNDEQQKHDLPTPSVGYIVDHILHKKGFSIGDAKISEKHAAFIENTGNATAKDYLTIIKTVIEETNKQLGIKLKPEIFFKGFSEEELLFIQ